MRYIWVFRHEPDAIEEDTQELKTQHATQQNFGRRQVRDGIAPDFLYLGRLNALAGRNTKKKLKPYGFSFFQ